MDPRGHGVGLGGVLVDFYTKLLGWGLFCWAGGYFVGLGVIF